MECPAVLMARQDGKDMGGNGTTPHHALGLVDSDCVGHFFLSFLVAPILPWGSDILSEEPINGHEVSLHTTEGRVAVGDGRCVDIPTLYTVNIFLVVDDTVLCHHCLSLSFVSLTLSEVSAQVKPE